MTAPTVTARGTPGGNRIPDGFSAKITFASNPTLSLYEKTLKPSGTDGGDPIDTTTMHNSTWMTMRAQQLKKSDPITVTAAYDPDFIPSIIALVNREDTISVHWATGDAAAVYGYLQKYEFGELKKGEFPEVTLTIVVTNWDPVGNVEAGYTYVPAAGT